MRSKTVQFGEGYGLPTAVVDPSVFADEILFCVRRERKRMRQACPP